MTTQRLYAALAILLTAAVVVGLALHPDPSCGEKPEPTGSP